MMQIGDKIKTTTEKFHVGKIHGFYLSVLEHEWAIIVEAASAHEIETICIETQAYRLSTQSR